MGQTGSFFLGVGLLISALLIVTVILGVLQRKKYWVELSRLLSYITVTCIGLASFILLNILIQGDYSVVYAYAYTSDYLPLVYKVSAFWAGDGGSLLLWTGLIGIALILYLIFNKSAKEKRGLVVIGVAALNIFLFMLVLSLKSNPFSLMEMKVSQGVGLNPMLRNPYMITHPLTLFIGYALLVVPFGMSVAYLIEPTKKSWVDYARPWVLGGWVFLTLGNLLGAIWAYQELGWGGYWAWDPVENASFIPWLLVTALLHTMFLEKRFSICRLWNFLLIGSAYLLTIFGTFIVRSGILQSVHAFADTGTGIYFITYIVVVGIGFLYLVRKHMVKSKPVEQEETLGINIILGGVIILFVTGFLIWVITIYPLISNMFSGETISFNESFYNTVTAPLFASLIFLMGLWPVIGYGNLNSNKKVKYLVTLLLISIGSGTLIYYFAQGSITAVLGFALCIMAGISIVLEILKLIKAKLSIKKFKQIFYRVPWAAHLAHLGVILLAIGVISTQVYGEHYSKTLHEGEIIQVSNYEIHYQGLDRIEGTDSLSILASLQINRDENVIAVLTPQRVFYQNWQPLAKVAIEGNWYRDVYVQLAGWENFGHTATLMIHINPLIRFIWVGGFFIAIGGLAAIFRRN